FFRLQGIHIQLPPFRKRSDRLQFAKMKLMEVARELGRPQLSFSKDAENFIETYDWPGNIRQVSHALRQAAFASPTSRIEVNAFPPYMKNCNKTISQTGSLLQDREIETIIQTITKTKGNMSEAARILGIGRNKLYKKNRIKGHCRIYTVFFYWIFLGEDNIILPLPFPLFAYLLQLYPSGPMHNLMHQSFYLHLL